MSDTKPQESQRIPSMIHAKSYTWVYHFQTMENQRQKILNEAAGGGKTRYL